MSVANILSMAGGLGLFLFGIRTMGDGLENAAGAKLKRMLEVLTGNRFLAVLVGFVVTAIIQSSTATTVMVVGFVNAGMMSLAQAVGVIMGANIGTTVTSLLIALNFSSVAAAAVLVGVILMLASKKTVVKNLGACYPPHICIMEGDTPSFLGLIRNGLGWSESPDYGGWGGRYVWRTFKDEPHPIWTSPEQCEEYYGTWRNGNSIVRWREDYQLDFARRPPHARPATPPFCLCRHCRTARRHARHARPALGAGAGGRQLRHRGCKQHCAARRQPSLHLRHATHKRRDERAGKHIRRAVIYPKI